MSDVYDYEWHIKIFEHGENMKIFELSKKISLSYTRNKKEHIRYLNWKMKGIECDKGRWNWLKNIDFHDFFIFLFFYKNTWIHLYWQ